MEAVLKNTVAFFVINGLVEGTKIRLSAPKSVRTIIGLVLFIGLLGLQIKAFVKHRPLNYFEELRLENSWPAPITVKQNYKKIMNELAQESSFNSTQVDRDEK